MSLVRNKNNPANSKAPAPAAISNSPQNSAMAAMRRAEALQRMLRIVNGLIARRPDRAMESWMQALLPIVLLKVAEYVHPTPQDIKAVASVEDNSAETPDTQQSFNALNRPDKFGKGHARKAAANKNLSAENDKAPQTTANETPEATDLTERHIAALQLALKQLHAAATASVAPQSSHNLAEPAHVDPVLAKVAWQIAEISRLDPLQHMSYDLPPALQIDLTPLVAKAPVDPRVALVAETGNVVLNGGNGTDTVSFRNLHQGVEIDLNLTTPQQLPPGRTVTLTNFDNLEGTQQDDVLKGNDGNNKIFGLDGNDLLDGGNGHNVLDGGNGEDTATYRNALRSVQVDLSDTEEQQVNTDRFDTLINIEDLEGSNFNDVLKGNRFNNRLSGGAGDDRLEGGDGNDTLSGGDGDDTLDGGLGNDTALYEDATSRVHVDLTLAGRQNTLGAGLDTLLGIENLKGSAFDDVLIGNRGDNRIEAGSGDDTIDGGDGNDALYGEAGNDTLHGGNGDDIIDGGAGNDTSTYADALSRVIVDLSLTTRQNTSGAGFDTLSNVENLIGSAFNDGLSGDANDNRIDAGAGDDTVNGGAGNDVLNGEAGNDTLSGGLGNDLIDGGAGNDTASYADAGARVAVDLTITTQQNTLGSGLDTLVSIENLIGSGYNDSLTGDRADNRINAGAGDDVVDGGDGNDALYGDAGNDMLHGGQGDDILDGGAGNDTATYADAASGVMIDLNLATRQNTQGAGFDTLSGIENLIGSSFNDTLTGDSSNNRIEAGAGDDMVSGGAGDDVLDGGAGNDTASYADATSRVVVDLSVTTQQNTLGAGLDTLRNFENLIGSAFNDTLKGNASDNRIDAGAGDDTVDGGEGNDTLSGGTGNDMLHGGLGDDVLDGGTGNDTANYADAASLVTVDLSLTTQQNTLGAGLDTLRNVENLVGTAFNDTLTGDSGNNRIDAGAGNDNVFGGDGNDALYGEAGSDVLRGGRGDDLLDGGDGNDTAVYTDATSRVVVDLTITTQQNTLGDGLDTLISIENLVGSAFNDTLTGDSGNNRIDASAGDDIVNGGAGDDILNGEAGDDILTGGLGDDFIDGGAGNDTASYADAVSGVSVNLTLATRQNTLGAGFDTLLSIENLIGSDHNDVLTGDGSSNRIEAGAGDDTVQGGGGNDTLLGGDGNDTLRGGAGDDLIDGGNGIDTVDYSDAASQVAVNLGLTGYQATLGAGLDSIRNVENLIGSAFNDTLTGDANNNRIDAGSGDDIVAGGAGDDVLNGEAGNDTISGGLGDDVIDGGTGNDTASYADATSRVNVDLSLATRQNTLGGGQDTLLNIENLIGSSFNDDLVGDSGNNRINAGAGDDTLDGGAGDDALFGEAGNDMLHGGSGNDSLDGGAGNDTATYADATSRVAVDLALATRQDTLGAGLDTLSNIENLIGSAFDDTLAGDGGNNRIDAGAGDDTINGGAGNDVLNGEAGNDLLSGGLGDDMLDGGAGTDTASYADASSRVTVNLSLTSQQNTLGAGLDTLSNMENLIGSAFNDTLTGDGADNRIDAGAGDDTISGGAGDDVLNGEAGNDTISGGSGDDLIDGGSGSDTASYADALSRVTVDLGLTTRQNTLGAGLDTLSNIENLIGSAFNDTLTGDGGNNRIDSGAGDDTVDGGAGDDSLYGEAGNDTLHGGLGNDDLDGGAGIDTADYSDAGSQLSISLLITGYQNTLGAGSDRLTSIENITGSAFDDQLTGSAANNVLLGGDGNDVLSGEGGDDTLDGGNGTDTASYSSALSGVTVSLITGLSSGGAGNDTLRNIENLIGSAFADTLTGDGNANDIRGGAGNDTLIGGAGDDILMGGAGNDTIDGGLGRDTVSYDDATAAVTVSLDAGTATGGAGTDTLTSMEVVIGSRFNDTIIGDRNNNELYGGIGNDTISGGLGDDWLDGGDGNDTASYADATAGVTVDLSITGAQNTGVTGNDTLVNFENVTGSRFNDQLFGNAGDNTVNGGDGDDTIDGGLGTDTLIGGLGTDTLVFNQAQSGVTVNLSVTTQQDTFGSGLKTISGFENITGTGFDDVLNGDNRNNTIIGGDGNDTINGGWGDDFIVGGKGTDSLDGGVGYDTISLAGADAGYVIDIYLGTSSTTGSYGSDSVLGFESVIGTDYNDTIYGNWADNLLIGGGGNDTIRGGNGNDTLYGGAGDDTLNGQGNDDTLYGGDGNDTLFGEDGDDTLDGGAGNDTASYLSSGFGVNVSLAITGPQNTNAGMDTLISIENLTGGGFNDTFIGNDGDNVLTGNYGDDILIGGLGNDTLLGGPGNDTASYSTATMGVVVDLNITTRQNTIGAGFDILTDIENLTGSDFNDRLTGDRFNNILVGGLGNDVLSGGDGADTLEGGLGDDIIDGGAGIDTASYLNATNGITIDLRLLTAQNTGQGMDTITNVENILTSAFDDTIIGSAFSNSFTDAGGDDSYDGGLGSDTVDYSRALSGVTVDLGISTRQNTGGGGNDLLISIESLTGSNFGDTLRGDNNGNMLRGGGGNDILVAGSGNDSVLGGLGDDDMDGGAGTDWIDYSDLRVSVTFDLRITTWQNTGAAGMDRAVNFENIKGSWAADTLTGDNSNNAINGWDGNDIIYGLDGNDNIYGGFGDDYIDGGDGIDTANYSDLAYGVTVDLSITGPQDTLGAGRDTLVNIENLMGNNENDTLTGNSGNNSIVGNGGNDLINGGAGDDFLDGSDGNDTVSYAGSSSGVTVNLSLTTAQNTGGAGIDTLRNFENITGSDWNDTFIGTAGDNVFNGGAGYDMVDYSNATGAITINLGIGTAQNTGSAGTDTFISIEHATGSQFDDVITGTNYWNNLYGGDGNDTLNGMGGGDNLFGGNGDDRLYGGSGADTLTGGQGNDLLDGGADTDEASYADATNGVTVSLLLAGQQQQTNWGLDTLISIENLTGSNSADTLIGDANNNVIDGGAGNDNMDGGLGNDTVRFQYATSGVVASLLTGTATGGAGNDTFVNFENITGSNFNDTLTGNAGANILNGGSGNDTLYGGLGNDILTGGTGADIFQFAQNDGLDQVTDFSVADRDVISLNATSFGIASGSAVANFVVSGLVAPDAAHGYFLVTDQGVWWDADGTGATAAVQLVQFTNPATGISAANFMFF